MAIPKVLCLSDPNKLWIYVDDTFIPSTKYISIYDDKHENSIAFELDYNEMEYLAESIYKYLENK